MAKQGQHFLLSASARTLSLAQVLRMSDTDAETLFASIRWPDTKGEPVCPHCGCFKPYTDRRPSGSLRFRCRDCEGFLLPHQRDAVRLPQAPAAHLSRGDCDLGKRGQGQKCFGVIA